MGPLRDHRPPAQPGARAGAPKTTGGPGLTALRLQDAYEILRDHVLHPGHDTGDGLIGRAVLVREGLAAWIRLAQPQPAAVNPLPAEIAIDVPVIPTAGIADAIATLILSLPMEKLHA